MKQYTAFRITLSRTNIANNGRPRLSRYAQVDGGAVVIHDDCMCPAPMKDPETVAIPKPDRWLFLPRDRTYWPDVDLLRRKRAFLGLSGC